MKNGHQEAADLLRQMGRLAIPLLPPEREASRYQRTASSVNLLVQRLSAEPEPAPTAEACVGAVAAGAASGELWFAAGQLPPAQRASGTPRGVR